MLMIPDSLKRKYPVDDKVYWRDESHAYYAGLVYEATDWYFGRVFTDIHRPFPCEVNIFNEHLDPVRTYQDIPSLEDAMALIYTQYLFGE